MAQDTSLNGLRNLILTSLYGRRAGLDSSDYLVGPRAFREQVEGVLSAGSTIVSTSVATNLSAYGISLVGATGASGTTAYNLSAPVTGLTKRLFNPTTGVANIGTTGAGAFICSTGSITSTYGNILLTGKGAMCELIALTTALWGVMTPFSITSATTGYQTQIS